MSSVIKVLVIEDEPEMRRNLLPILRLEKFHVVAAENGRGAVDLAKKEKPDIVLCDVMMPELDGYGVLQHLRDDPATASIPFIFLTARGEKSEVRSGTKYCEGFRQILQSGGLKIVLCPPRVPQCHAYAERFLRTIKAERLSRLIFLSEQHLLTTASTFADYYRRRRNHQGIGNKLIEPPVNLPAAGRIRCRKELGGMLNYYYREAA